MKARSRSDVNRGIRGIRGILAAALVFAATFGALAQPEVFAPGAGAGVGALTPWTTDINAAGFGLTNVGRIIGAGPSLVQLNDTNGNRYFLSTGTNRYTIFWGGATWSNSIAASGDHVDIGTNGTVAASGGVTSATLNTGSEVITNNIDVITNQCTTGNGTATVDMTKLEQTLITNTTVAIQLANVPTSTERSTVVTITNSAASGNTWALTFTGFSVMTNGYPCAGLFVTNLTAKAQVAKLSISCRAGGLTNASLMFVFNP